MEKTLIEARRDYYTKAVIFVPFYHTPSNRRGEVQEPLARDVSGSVRGFASFEEAEQVCRTYEDVYETSPCESTWSDVECRWVGPEEDEIDAEEGR